MPVPAEGEVLVEVKAAGINPGEAAIRRGDLDSRWPTTFPSGEGSDLAGVVVGVGSGVTTFALGDEVLGFSFTRSSHATHTVVPVTQLIRKPAELSWPAAGALYVVGCTAFAAVRAIDPQPGETVAVSAAAGGVGTIVVQLLALRGARILGIASPSNDAWLVEHGVVPVHYGAGRDGGAKEGTAKGAPDDLSALAANLTAAAPNGIDAFIDLFGDQYVQLAADLGIARDRIETIAGFAKAAELGTKNAGSTDASTPDVLAEVAGLVASGAVEIPIAATYPLDEVARAFEQLEQRHTRGKIVLNP